MNPGRESRFDKHRVAAVTLEAMRLEIPILRALQEVFEIDVETARWVQRWSRQNGTLGFAQHRPARAIVRRGTRKERTWLACEFCTQHWPCEAAKLYAMIATPRRNRRGRLREPAQQDQQD